MSGRRRAWVYCSIDAPEDENDMLKKQRELLWEYVEQMGFEVAGVVVKLFCNTCG